MTAPGTGAIEYVFKCSACAEENRQGFFVLSGDEYPRPSVPPGGWKVISGYPGSSRWYCPAHKVELLVDGKPSTA